MMVEINGESNFDSKTLKLESRSSIMLYSFYNRDREYLRVVLSLLTNQKVKSWRIKNLTNISLQGIMMADATDSVVSLV